MSPVKFPHVLAMIATMLIAPAALAQDAGLYDKPVDPNSAFVRVLLPGAGAANVDGNALTDLSNGFSAYVNVQPGDIEVSAGDASATVTAEPGAYYTLGWAPDGTALTFNDLAPSDPSKAQVYLYNLSDKPAVGLYVPAAKVDAITDVAINGTAAVALKAPLTLDVEVRSGSETLASIAGIDLQRKGGVSIVLTGSGTAYEAQSVENAFFRGGATN